MALQTPAYIGVAGFATPVETDRNLVEAIFGRSGVIRPGHFAFTPLGSSQLGLSIAAGQAVLIGQESDQQGAYFVWSDAAETKLFNTPSGSPRIDSVILRVADSQYGTISGVPRAYWDFVPGVASGSPVARPDSDFNSGGSKYVPGAWWRAADVRIDPTDVVVNPTYLSNGLKTTYARTAGFTLCTSSTRPTDAAVGDRIYEIDTKKEYTWDGTYWVNKPGQRITTLTGTPSTLNQDTLGSESDAFTTNWTPPHLGRFRIVVRAPYWSANGGVYVTMRSYIGGVLQDYDTRIMPPGNNVIRPPLTSEAYQVTSTSVKAIKATGQRRTGSATGGGDNWNSSADNWYIDITYVGA